MVGQVAKQSAEGKEISELTLIPDVKLQISASCVRTCEVF